MRDDTENAQRAPEHSLQLLLHVNRPSGQHRGNGALVLVDPERHALEVRIERAKSRIVEDLNRASGLLRDVAARAGRGLGRVVVLSGLFVAGVALAVLVRRRRRLRITWR
jgi:hypothetical protein